MPGAVELIPDGASPPNLTETKPAETNAKDLSVPAAWKFSLAGVGLKFSMLRDGERLTIPGKNQLGNWIVKLPDAVHPIVTINEFAMMSAAKEVGIDVPAVRLVDRSELPDLPDSVWPNGESTAYAVARFDRSPDGGRIHIEDFSQIRGFYPQDKYSGSFETVGALSYRNRDVDSLVEYVRRMTFNMLIGNGDAHLKNWSMIYEDGRTAKLSPAYDLVSTAPYVRWPDVEDLGLKFGRNRQFSRVSWKNFADLESKIGAKGSNLTGVVEDTVLRFDAVLSSALLDEWKGSIFYDWIIQNFDTMSQQLLR
ncbi:type II toxin-antitoxin system HipA family toxin [Rhodococcus qingshengii]|uniref:type II toxin-antitoxin system HipA family toxin n=1 Tax=Rhodococcus qingshengii TaxID=334542 RepID=UPI0027DFFAAB|nr:HipA domain-containing protein [Rhodococcus qingshengii]